MIKRAGLPVSPFEFVAQDVVVRVVRKANEAGAMRGSADVDRIAWIHDKSNLAIEKCAYLIFARERDFQSDLTGNKERSMG